MFYVITAIRPDGSVGRRLTCSTKERADSLAEMVHTQNPTWKILVRPSSGQSGSIDIVRSDAPEFRGDSRQANTEG
jgi:hypothetical protein